MLATIECLGVINKTLEQIAAHAFASLNEDLHHEEGLTRVK